MRLLKRYPNFFLFSLALTLSGIGSSLTGVAIYELMRLQGTPPESYSLMFALTFLPAFFASNIAKRISLRVRFSGIFVLLNLLGIGFCAANLWNLQHGSTAIYYATILFGGLVNGIYFPLYQILLKRTIKESDLAAFSVYETVVFGLQFVFGELLGTLFFSLLGPAKYFQADIVTFLVCSITVVGLARLGKLSFDPLKGEEKDGEVVAPPVRWNDQKKQAFSINILLAAVAAPLMAVMLAHFSKLSSLSVFGLTLSPILLGLSARSLGQIIGPMIGGMIGLEKLTERRFSIEICMALFLASYAIVFAAPGLLFKIAFVTIAHVFSNIVFSLGFYRFNKAFALEEFPTVATQNYQVVTGVMIFSAIWASFALPIGGEALVLTGSVLIFSVTSALKLIPAKRGSYVGA